MIKFDLTAVLYSKRNYDMEHKLHKLCQSSNINLITVLDFVELTIKCITLKPNIIFCDCSTITCSSSNISAFLEQESFKNTKIIFVGSCEQIKVYKNFANKNILTCEINELPFIIDQIQSQTIYNEILENQNVEQNNELSMAIYKLLCSIGFSAKHSGSLYLRECIKNVILNNCIVHALASEYYPYIAVLFKTNTINVERNIRNSIECAWETYGKDNWYKIFYSKSMKMGKKPTNREFIYLCSEIIQSQIKYNIIPNYDAI